MIGELKHLSPKLFVVSPKQGELVKSGPLKIVEKIWGTEYWYVNEPEYCCKLLEVKRGCSSSLHRHVIKKETFMVVRGVCFLEMNAVTMRLCASNSVTIPSNTWHKFYVGRSDRGCSILEVSTHHDDADVVRREPSRGM